MVTKEEANYVALKKILESKPIWIDIKKAKDVVPGMNEKTILHSGPPISWENITGGQRQAIIGACIYEKLALTEKEVDKKIKNESIILKPCQDHDCIGSLTGVYFHSMPVFVVKDEASNQAAFCSIYEGSQKERLTYGVFNDKVIENLNFINEIIAPILEEIVHKANGISLKPIMSRALRMGDELHSRNTA